MATFKLTPGVDNFTGTPGQNNLFEFTTADLQGTDTVTGVAAGPFVDILALTQPGTVTATQFAGVTNIEQFNLSNGTNDVALTNGLVGGSSLGYFNIADGSGNDTVDGSSVTTQTLYFYGSVGNETFRGGSLANYYLFAPTNLTSVDTIVGGAGFDAVAFTSAGIVAAGAFTNVSNLEAIYLAPGPGSNILALTGAIGTGSTLGYLGIVGSGTGDDTVNLSGATSGTAVVYAKSGNDGFTGGGLGTSTYYLFNANELTSADTVTGGAGFDVVQFETGGGAATDAFNGVTKIEALFLNAGGNSVTLNESTVADSMLGHFVIVGGGSSVVNAVGVTTETLHFYAGGGVDTFVGGGGVDVFLVDGADLDATDTFDGNGGTNYLQISSGVVGAPALAGISDITFLGLSAGGGVILANTLSSTRLYVTGSAASDTFSGLNVTNYEIAFYGFGGTDALVGGSKNDLFHIQDTAFTNIDGGAGIDYLIPTLDNLTLDITANANKIDNLEVIWLDQAANVTVSLTNTDIPQLNAIGNSLYVVGGADDELTVGDVWTVIGPHTNAAVAPGVTFTQYHNATTSSDLFVDDDILLTISTGVEGTPPTVVSEDILTGEDFNVEICNTVFGDAEAEEAGADVQATFTVARGNIVAYDATGAITVNGSGTGTLTLTGTIAEINAFVADDQITYVPQSNDAGFVNLSIEISDLEPGVAGTATANQTITIAPETDGAVVRSGTPGIQRTIGTEPVGFSALSAAIVNPEGNDPRFDGGENEDESNVHTAALPDGGFVMVWQEDGSIYGQVFGQNGDPESVEPFYVAGVVAGINYEPSVAVLNDGRFVVTWAEQGGTAAEVNGRIFLAGAAMGDAFNVASFTLPAGATIPMPEVAALSDGGFIVAWAQNQAPESATHSQLFTRSYDASGVAAAAVERDNLDGQIFNTEVVGRSDFRFTLGYEATPDPVSEIPQDRFVAFVAFDGGSASSAIALQDGTAAFERAPELVIFADGSVVGIWSSQQGSTTDLMAIQFDAAGHLVSPIPTRLVGTADTLDPNEFGASATVLADGGLAVSWLTPTISSNSNDVFTQVFNADLTPRTSPALQLTFDDGQRINEHDLASAALGDGRYLLSWIRPDTDVFGAPDAENSGTGDDILYNIFEPGTFLGSGGDIGAASLPSSIFLIDDSEIFQRVIIDQLPEGWIIFPAGHRDDGTYTPPDWLGAPSWVIDRASGDAAEIAFLNALASDPDEPLIPLTLMGTEAGPLTVEVRATTVENGIERTTRAIEVHVDISDISPPLLLDSPKDYLFG